MRIWPTKRRWKRLAIGIATIVALALIANGFMAWLIEYKLQTKIAAIRAAGDPASIADLAPEPILADQNAAAHLERIAPRLDDFSKDYLAFYNSPLGKAYDSAHDRGVPPTPEQIAAIRAILDKYSDIAAALAAAAACDQYASLANFSLSPHVFLEEVLDKRATKIRIAARYNDWRMRMLMADGKPQQAAERGVELLRIARLHDDEPLLLNYLLGVAIRGIAVESVYDALAAGAISPQLHIELDEELAEHDETQRLVQALRTERAYSAALTASICDGEVCNQVNPLWMSMVGWPVKWLYVGALDSYDRHFTLATKSWEETCSELGPPDGDPPPTGDGVLADLMLPSLKAAYVANARNIAKLRALRIFNALTQYRDEHGREASGLEELSLPEEATIDPFSGEPLKLKHSADGWIIYSVMQNGVDDGGDFQGLKDYGLAPAKLRATE